MGNLYIADENNNRVLKETLSSGNYVESVVASGLNAPLGLAGDSQGNVYVADTWNNRLVEETLSAGLYTQSVIATGLYSAQGVTVAASGKIYVTQSGSSGVDEVQLAKIDFTLQQDVSIPTH